MIQILGSNGATTSDAMLENQVQPFRLSTPDGESLYAWHILPVILYFRNERNLVLEPSGVANNATTSKAFRLLKEDPESRLVISCR